MLADPLAQHVKRRRKYLILQIPRIMCWNDGQESQSLSANKALILAQNRTSAAVVLASFVPALYKQMTRPMSCHARFQLSLILLLLVGTTCFADPREPKEFPDVEAAVNASITRGDIPGAMVLVGHDGKVVYRRAFGLRSVEPTPEPMTTDTIFDVSSLTKVVATAPAIMRMVSLGQLRQPWSPCCFPGGN